MSAGSAGGRDDPGAALGPGDYGGRRSSGWKHPAGPGFSARRWGNQPSLSYGTSGSWGETGGSALWSRILQPAAMPTPASGAGGDTAPEGAGGILTGAMPMMRSETVVRSPAVAGMANNGFTGPARSMVRRAATLTRTAFITPAPAGLPPSGGRSGWVQAPAPTALRGSTLDMPLVASSAGERRAADGGSRSRSDVPIQAGPAAATDQTVAPGAAPRGGGEEPRGGEAEAQGPQSSMDLDAWVEKVWPRLMRKLAIERERRGYAGWPWKN
jgi:hypothetical protein